MAEWYEELKPGDKVGIVNKWRNRVNIVEIERVTPSGQILAGGRKFKPRSFAAGKILEMGTTYPDHLISLDEANQLKQELEAAQYRQNLIGQLQSANRWNAFSTNQLEQVIKLIESFKESKSE